MVHKRKSIDLRKVEKSFGKGMKPIQQSIKQTQKGIRTLRIKTKPIVKGARETFRMSMKGLGYAQKGFEKTMGLQAEMMDRMWDEQEKLKKELEVD